MQSVNIAPSMPFLAFDEPSNTTSYLKHPVFAHFTTSDRKSLNSCPGVGELYDMRIIEKCNKFDSCPCVVPTTPKSNYHFEFSAVAFQHVFGQRVI